MSVDWKTSIWGVPFDCVPCCGSIFCPWCIYHSAARKYLQEEVNCVEISLSCCCIFGCLLRESLRDKYKLKGGPCSDLCVHCCCQCFALAQVYREAKAWRPDPVNSSILDQSSRTVPPKPQVISQPVPVHKTPEQSGVLHEFSQGERKQSHDGSGEMSVSSEGKPLRKKEIPDFVHRMAGTEKMLPTHTERYEELLEDLGRELDKTKRKEGAKGSSADGGDLQTVISRGESFRSHQEKERAMSHGASVSSKALQLHTEFGDDHVSFELQKTPTRTEPVTPTSGYHVDSGRAAAGPGQSVAKVRDMEVIHRPDSGHYEVEQPVHTQGNVLQVGQSRYVTPTQIPASQPPTSVDPAHSHSGSMSRSAGAKAPESTERYRRE